MKREMKGGLLAQEMGDEVLGSILNAFPMKWEMRYWVQLPMPPLGCKYCVGWA